MALRQPNRDLVGFGRVAEAGLQRETVELRLRQRERPLLLDRVLRRDHEKGLRQRPSGAVDRHLALGHRLEQRRLRARHRAVDLVDKYDIREDRALTELELAVLLAEDREPGDVRRLEIRGALDTGERRRFDLLRERARAN